MNQLTRRRFLQQSAITAAGIAAGCSTASPPSAGGPNVSINWADSDSVATSPSAQWAVARLRESLESRGISVALNQPARTRIDIMFEACPAESFEIVPTPVGLAVMAADDRGFVYALLELADRIDCSPDVRTAINFPTTVSESPANRIRSVTRLFVSDVEDKSWFHDRDFWREYLTMLAASRFNRFNLALGLGYDAPNHLRDTYFYFAYPFLLDVPGYSVRAAQLPSEERDCNLSTLQFISEQTKLRGMDFQLGLWTHGYEWTDSPDANYVIDGLTPALQAPYCRDALHMLLEACPAITGITLRIHGESGVPEGDYNFWRTLFTAVTKTGRKIELDLHAKGIDQPMIDVALETGLPVTVSPKFWAEHMGLPYMPASIRQTEMPSRRPGNGFFSLSNGSRSFMRYSFGDLLRTDRKYRVLHRVWPGTQRLLVWGDPKFAAAYGRTFSFCGTDGVEFFDPLSFKGRKGSGLPGNRDGYADQSLHAAGGDWRKFLYTYRLLGRLTYNPDTPPEVWQRLLRKQHGPAAPAVENSLAAASRILPLITSSHDPSAANYNYWPEMYTNMSLFDAAHPGPYTDTPRPRDFCHVSALDPQLFATPAETADALLSGKPLAKYTPLDVANILDKWSAAAQLQESLARRESIDCTIAAGIGKFFACKFRAAVLYSLYQSTAQPRALSQAKEQYTSAARAWSEAASAAASAYATDITFGPDTQMRGNWSQRKTAILQDIDALSRVAAPIAKDQYPLQTVIAAIDAVFASPRQELNLLHTPPAPFAPGSPIHLELAGKMPAKLWYRHVDQSEVMRSAQMQRDGQTWRATIPADFTNPTYAIQYYFELEGGGLFPGLGQDFEKVPYFVIQPA